MTTDTKMTIEEQIKNCVRYIYAMKLSDDPKYAEEQIAKETKLLLSLFQARDKEIIEEAQIGLLKDLNYKPYNAPDTFQAGVEFVKSIIHQRLDKFLSTLPTKEEKV